MPFSSLVLHAKPYCCGHMLTHYCCVHTSWCHSCTCTWIWESSSRNPCKLDYYPSFSALRFFPSMLFFQHATAHACTRLACIIALCLFDACEPDMCSSIIMWSGSLLAGIAISITTKNPCETGGKNKKQSFPLCVHQSVNTLCFLRRRSHISHAPATHTTPRANLQPKSRQYPA